MQLQVSRLHTDQPVTFPSYCNVAVSESQLLHTLIANSVMNCMPGDIGPGHVIVRPILDKIVLYCP